MLRQAVSQTESRQVGLKLGLIRNELLQRHLPLNVRPQSIDVAGSDTMFLSIFWRFISVISGAVATNKQAGCWPFVSLGNLERQVMVDSNVSQFKDCN